MTIGDGVTAEELRAFVQACASRRCDAEAFSLECMNHVSDGGGKAARTIVVRRDDIMRCYEASLGRDWVADFAQEFDHRAWD
jgi:hypothetical protein